MQPTDIANNSVLKFDARRLLGLPPGADLPVGFNDPAQMNLLNILKPTLADKQPDKARERATAVQLQDAATGRRHRLRYRRQ
ncbi:hypothetical protein V7S43_010710 [Phytophthora oleae]|uniref:RxLR effector protein n=1 Tax=Phytophthora oleae TaxID=2107226 RepID=A0ABD3FEP6_9STRA